MTTSVTLTFGATGRQYLDLPSAWAAIPSDLVAADVQYILEGYNDAEFVHTSTITLQGKNTSSVNNIIIRCGTNQSFITNANVATNALRYNQANGVAIKITQAYTNGLVINNNYVTIEGIQVSNGGSGGGTGLSITGGVITGVVVDRCLVEQNKTATSGAYGAGVANGKMIDTVIILNGVSSSGVAIGGNATGICDGLTIMRPHDKAAAGNGFEGSVSGCRIQNCLVDNLSNFSNRSDFVGSHNAFSGTTVPFGTGNMTNVDMTTVFQNNASNATADARTKTGAPTINQGTSPISGNVYTINGNRQQGTAADIGAWEYPEAVQAPIATITSITVSGTTVTISGTTSGTPTSGTGTISPTSDAFNNAVAQGPTSLTLGSGTFTITYTGVRVGKYNFSGTVVNSSFTTSISGSGVFEVTSATVSSLTQQPLDGNVLTISGTTAGTPTSGTFYVPADPSTPAGATNQNVAVTLGTGTLSASIALPAGNYAQGYVTVTNADGTSFPFNSGLSAVSVVSISGTPQSTTMPSNSSATAPDAPTNVTATAGDGSATVNFTPPLNNGGSTITSYLVTASTGQTATGTSSPITISVPNGTAVTFTVQAENAIGLSAASTASNSVTPAANTTVTPPSAPLNVSATAGNGIATVSFDPPSNTGNSGITNYTVTASTGQTASGSSSPINVTVPNGTAVTFTVTATNAAGTGPASAPSNSVTPTATVIPVTVTSVTITPANATIDGGGIVQLSASVNLSGDNPKGTVTWTTTLGTITPSGLYTGPVSIATAQAAIITAKSDDDPTKYATAVVAIAALPVVVNPDPNTARIRSYSGYVRNRFGTALEGVSVTVFDQDTGNKVTLWKDEAKTEEKYNPLTTDDEGFFEFFVESKQCGYSVKGFGIAPYTRNNIFDIGNVSDLTPLKTDIEDLKSSKANVADLVSLSASTARLSDLTALSSAVNVLSQQVTRLVTVNNFVTGGNGTAALPWTGWDTAIQWSADTRYDFLEGYYAYTESPNFALNGLHLRGRGTYIVHTGTNYAMIVDAGETSGSASRVQVTGITLVGNINSDGGILARGCYNSKFHVEFLNIPNICFKEVSCVLCDYRLTRTTEIIQSIVTNTLLQSERRVGGIRSTSSSYYLIGEGMTGAVVNLVDCTNGRFNNGTLASSVTGLSITSTSSGNVFNGIDINNNSLVDVQCDGDGNSFNFVRSGGLFNIAGSRNHLLGGQYDAIKIYGDGNSLNSLSYSSNKGLFSDRGSNTVKRSLFNMNTSAYDDDQAMNVSGIVSTGKTILSSDTMNIGDGQVYKNPAGLVGIGQSAFISNAPLQVTNNIDDSATQCLRLNMQTSAYAVTATHINCNSGGSDVFMVLGNGNVQNLNNSYAALSDIRLKENITDATAKLDQLMQVRVVNYNLIGKEEKLLGVVAQELMTIFPGMLSEVPKYDEDGKIIDSFYTVKYSVFVPMLIKAIQELNAKVTALQGA